MDRFEAMRIFARVADLNSFTQAAESLNLPKASVSTAVSSLESHIQAKLLHRTTRRVQLTPEGRAFYERCQELLLDLEETEGMFRTDSTSLSGKIRVDMTVSMARGLVIPRLSEFLAEHPQLEVEFSSTDRFVDLIREGMDCVVRVGSAPPNSGLANRDLGELELINCISPAYQARYGLPQNLEQLSQHKLVHYVMNWGSKPEGFEYLDGEAYRCIEMDSLISVNNTDSYQAACLAGLGIIQAPRAGLKHLLQTGALIEILPAFKAEPLALKLVYPPRRLRARRVRIFMDWLTELVKDYAA